VGGIMKKLKDEGFKNLRVFSPMPNHEIEDAVDWLMACITSIPVPKELIQLSPNEWLDAPGDSDPSPGRSRYFLDVAGFQVELTAARPARIIAA
jgi:hypothetical protein